ncbi:LysR family transcriptional regulator [Paraburkholderia sp. Ac-20340]|uniref:LysR substrate-binding domain-containing protein n=1 Tax=Paraburkholderia sp. Ac-20340 TaxID=2703888 RepID=UPI0019822F75|nr:LysR substrate-binding domain-containing protein [Paraburkholderia sp. Ac-20340]MBN3853244.1 LysR family transcriptional regulator [Paraburkholderia sp. Ac-20340]
MKKTPLRAEEAAADPDLNTAASPAESADESPHESSARSHVLARLRLRHLNCIVAIAQAPTMALAAQRLHLSQPALSKTLSELEQWAGRRLVERGRNGATLTAEGEHFLRYALDVRRAVDASAAALTRENATHAAAVRVGALPTVKAAVLPAAIVSMQTVLPGVGIKVRVESNAGLLGALKSGALDLMVGRMAEPSNMPGISFEYLYTESLAMVARTGHPLAGAALALDEALAYPLVIAGEHTAPRHHIEAFFESSGLPVPAGCVETQSASVARGVVMNSLAVWIVPQRVVQGDLDAGRLTALDVPVPRDVEQIGILRRSAGPFSGAVETFAEQLRRAVAPIPAR